MKTVVFLVLIWIGFLAVLVFPEAQIAVFVLLPFALTLLGKPDQTLQPIP